MTPGNEPRWVYDCEVCGAQVVAGSEVCPHHTLPLTEPAATPEEQARRDRVTEAIVKFQSKPAKPPRRWRR